MTTDRLLRLERRDTPLARVLVAATLIGAIGLLDWYIESDVAFGFLYLLPVILLGTVLPGWLIVCVAAVCTGLADLFDPVTFSAAITIPHDILVVTSLGGTGLFVRALTTLRRREQEHLEGVEREATARRAAEEQLEFVVQTSPAAILTMTQHGDVMLANPAAHALFRVAAGTLPGRNISQYVAPLSRIRFAEGRVRPVQSEVQCRCVRDTGETFLADVFFATYETSAGPRIAALVVDVSEALRERELAGLEQFLSGSRVLMRAVSHEILNVSSAIAVTAQNLARGARAEGDKDIEALGMLVETLRQIASSELKPGDESSQPVAVDLMDMLTELRMVLDPYCAENGIDLQWRMTIAPVTVWADAHRVLQVLLNLVRNSERAMAECPIRAIEVAVSVGAGVASIRASDSGPGLQSTVRLFEPFQSSSRSSGLGLYLSRALLRSFGGNLRHDAAVPGCCFVIDLPLIEPRGLHAAEVDAHDANPTAAG